MAERTAASPPPRVVFRNEAEYSDARRATRKMSAADASTDSVGQDASRASLSLLMPSQRNAGSDREHGRRSSGEGVIAGMATSRGDAIVYMDADLQDPPEVIPALIDRWRSGADVVHTVRTRRHGENPLKMAATRLAYRLIHLGSSVELPVDAGDFKLLSLPAVDHLLGMRESDPYLRGLVVGRLQPVCVPYERDSRLRGSHPISFLQQEPVRRSTTGLTCVLVHADLCLFRPRRIRPGRARLFAVAGSRFMAALTFSGRRQSERNRRRRHLSHPRL